MIVNSENCWTIEYFVRLRSIPNITSRCHNDISITLTWTGMTMNANPESSWIWRNTTFMSGRNIYRVGRNAPKNNYRLHQPCFYKIREWTYKQEARGKMWKKLWLKWFRSTSASFSFQHFTSVQPYFSRNVFYCLLLMWPLVFKFEILKTIPFRFLVYNVSQGFLTVHGTLIGSGLERQNKISLALEFFMWVLCMKPNRVQDRRILLNEYWKKIWTRQNFVRHHSISFNFI